MRLKGLDKPEEWAWIESRAHPVRDEFTTGIVAYDDNDRIAAVFLADAFSEHHCGVHLAIDNPMVIRKGFLNTCLDYVFNQRGVKRVFGQVPANNQKALRFNKRIGFKIASIIPDGYKTGVDLVIMRLDAADNRWKVADNQKRAA